MEMSKIPAHLPLWVGGQEVVSLNTFENRDPYTGDVLCEVSVAGADQIDAAVEQARVAQASWRDTTPAERARVLREAARLLREHNDELARLETMDTGRPIRETSQVDVISAAECFEYFASLIQVSRGGYIELGPAAHVITRRVPLGVCGGIGAWNYPLQVAAWKTAPALAAGNAMLFKASEWTPVTAFYLGKILKAAGLPDGLFSVLSGAGEVGAALVNHPGIRKISLTGSVPTGKKIMEACGRNLKKVSLELGGKSPLIIFADADIDRAVQAALLANFYSQGEICSNGTRVFVERRILPEFTAALTEQVRKMKIGDPLDPATHIGPLIHDEHASRVKSFIDQAVTEGAEIVRGGDVKDRFAEPVILTHCRDDMTVCREEIFGPVLSLLDFGGEEEVIRRANDTEFGLAAGVFSQDIDRANRVARRLEAGILWINHYNITPIEMPFGGVRQSGLGRENGWEALEEYTQIQTIYTGLKDDPVDFFA